MIKLIDLEPKWIGLTQWCIPSKFYVGLSFLCPHCDPTLPSHGENRRRRLAVMFWPPIDPENLMGKLFDLPHNGGHKRTGDSFETITLDPSIGFESFGHWHGRIMQGEITT